MEGGHFLVPQLKKDLR